MRENNRKPIEKCIKKLPQFTTMNVIDGQAGLVIYSSLNFYSLTIYNILNIIVLLILAGVSIAMLTGQNGILTQAQRAKTETSNAEEDELRGLTALEAATNLENTIYIDNSTGEEKTVTIPAGFAVSQVEGENTVDDGLVIIDSKGNEFVWVPVNIDNYVRIDFGIQAGLYSTYHETLSDIESESIQKYGGYYIGRYEAGDYESTHNRTYRDENSSSDNTISIRRGQVPYNYISVEQAIILSNDMKEKQGYSSVNTRLCSSYAYDAAVTFISKVEKNYALSSPQGNYKDRSFKYIDRGAAAVGAGGNKHRKRDSGGFLGAGNKPSRFRHGSVHPDRAPGRAAGGKSFPIPLWEGVQTADRILRGLYLGAGLV